MDADISHSLTDGSELEGLESFCVSLTTIPDRVNAVRTADMPKTFLLAFVLPENYGGARIIIVQPRAYNVIRHKPAVIIRSLQSLRSSRIEDVEISTMQRHSSSNRPVAYLTVILEIDDVSGQNAVIIEPYAHSRHPPDQQTRLLILFDGLFHAHERRICQRFESSRYMAHSKSPGRSRHTMTYFLHFIPLHTYNRKACLVLPSHLYRHIAWHVADSDRFGYRKDLLNLALISKDWSDAISVFFEIPLETYSWDMPSVISYRLALTHRPDRAQLIRRFTLNGFREGRNWSKLSKQDQRRVIDTATDILCLATAVQELHITHVEMLHGTVPEVLASLHEVNQVILTLPYHLDPDLDRSCNVLDVLPTLLNFWPRLNALTVVGPRSKHEPPNSRNHGIIPAFSEIKTLKLCNSTRDCNIKQLYLADVFISDTQFLDVFRGPNPRLTTLTLSHIIGISNKTLLQVFSTVATTLTDIMLENIVLMKGADEEHALDVIIPDLTSIFSLCIWGNGYSPLLLAQKPPVPPAHLLIWAPPEGIFDALIDAMGCGGWASISFHGLSTSAGAAVSRASKIAQEKGFGFKYSFR